MRIGDAQADLANYPEQVGPFDRSGIDTVVQSCQDHGMLDAISNDLMDPSRVKDVLGVTFQPNAKLQKILQQTGQAIVAQVKKVVGAVAATLQSVVNALNALLAWFP